MGINLCRRVGVLLAVLSIPLLASCSKFKPSSSPVMDASFFSAGDGSLIPSSDKLANDCASRSEFDTCLFLKNPVAQNRAPVTAADLQAQRRFGVKLRGLSTSGRLENASVQVLTLHTPRFSLFTASHLRAPVSDSASYAEQLMAYYWANRSIEYLSARVGSARLKMPPLKIYVDDTFTGYSAGNHSLHLAKRDGEISKAFSADVILQLMGQALANSLSGGKTFNLGSLAQHKFCRLDPKGCCSSNMGCAGALGGAFGDYYASLMFPANPQIGETVAADSLGMKVCGLARDVKTLAAKSRAEAYSACADASGNTVVMGSWFASVWWSLRAQSEALDGAADIDILFFENAKTWTAASTFTESKTKALQLAATYKNGKYMALMQKVFTENGF